jgi:hypothetical protein
MHGRAVGDCPPLRCVLCLSCTSCRSRITLPYWFQSVGCMSYLLPCYRASGISDSFSPPFFFSWDWPLVGQYRTSAKFLSVVDQVPPVRCGGNLLVCTASVSKLSSNNLTTLVPYRWVWVNVLSTALLVNVETAYQMLMVGTLCAVSLPAGIFSTTVSG